VFYNYATEAYNLMVILSFI